MPSADGCLRIVNSIAPIRICDNGGWTDTWFAKYGKVFSIAVSPCVDVQMQVFEHQGERTRITINAEDYGERYTISEPRGVYDKHPLLETAIDFMHIPPDVAVEVTIHCDAPSGCSTGTSAAVSVALIGALDCLTPGRMTAHEVARAAHQIETELLGQQCGIQDQIASAYGGINYIDIPNYPHASVSPIPLSSQLWWELESRLLLVYVGSTHSSSKVHEKVIRELEDAGPDSPKLQALRTAAERAKDALVAGDLRAFGQSMIENTCAQHRLNASLIGSGHARIIEIAKGAEAIGWKVNGAGGDGGSVTVLCRPERSAKRALLREIEAADPGFRSIPISLCSHGLRTWESALG